MSRTYYSKKRFQQRIDHIKETRRRLADATDVTVLSTAKDAYVQIKKAARDLTRHPKGTKASGLRKEFKGKMTVASLRDRFDDADVQSSRLRGYRRNAIHSMRNRLKNEIQNILTDSFLLR